MAGSKRPAPAKAVAKDVGAKKSRPLSKEQISKDVDDIFGLFKTWYACVHTCKCALKRFVCTKLENLYGHCSMNLIYVFIYVNI